MKPLFCAILLGSMSLMMACSEVSRDDKAATALLENYFQAIKSGDFDQAAAYYPERKRDQWKAFLRTNLEKMGPLKQFSIDHSAVSTVYSGVYFVFTMDNRYQNRDATEIITLFQEVDQKKPWLNFHKTK